MSAGPEWLAIAAGGALGAMLRATIHRALAGLVRRRHGVVDPSVATLAANALGCAALGGWLAGAGARAEAAWIDSLLTVGLCGGLTTFSTLCADAIRLDRSDRTVAARYLAATVAAGSAGWWLGGWLGG